MTIPTTYFIAKVYDYKGGELSIDTFSTYNDLLSELVESLGDSFPDLSPISTKDEILACLNANPAETSTYVGGDGFCGTIYEVINNQINAIGDSPNDFNEDLADYIFTNLSNYL